MKISQILANLSPDPLIAMWTIEGLILGERADPQMTEDEKLQVRAAKLRVQRDADKAKRK